MNERDGDIFQDDYVGFYLSPPESNDVYFFGVNGTGAERISRNDDGAWNGDWQVSQIWDQDFWRVEFRLPLRAFSGEGEWGINFLHGARQVEPMESIWGFQPAQIRPLVNMHLSSDEVSFALLEYGDLNEGVLEF